MIEIYAYAMEVIFGRLMMFFWTLFTGIPILIWSKIFSIPSFLAALLLDFKESPDQLIGEIALVIGSNSDLGVALSKQIVKLRGTVICVDDSKEQGEALVNDINSSGGVTKAYFYECDLQKPNDMEEIIESVTKDIGAITTVFNCTTKNNLGVYFSLYNTILPVMKSKNKGALVFLRSFDLSSLNLEAKAIQGLYEAIKNDLKVSLENKITTTVAHVYPKINKSGAKNIFGDITPDNVAREILAAVSRKVPEIYVPGYMRYVFSWLELAPTGYSMKLEKALLGDS